MIRLLEQYVRNAPGNAHAPEVPKPYELSLDVRGCWRLKADVM